MVIWSLVNSLVHFAFIKLVVVLMAYQSLAISYTNESYDRASHGMLLRWLQARFPHHDVPAETIEAVKSHSSWDAHTRLTETFIDLARTQHAQNMLDPDVQNALGVLFFTNQQYEHAKDCFESALSVKPDVSYACMH
jgi:peroxin-5